MTRLHFALAVSALAAVSACTPPAKQPVLNIHGAQTTLPAVKGNPSAVYFDITGGPQDVRLLSVLAGDALRVEMHESVNENGVVSMKQLTAVDVPAKSRIQFKQGGKHVMIWGINDAAAKRGSFPMTFVFSNNDRIVADVKVNPAPTAGGADDMAGLDHSAMDHDKMGESKTGTAEKTK